MKKFSLLLAVLMIVTFAFTGCGKSKTESAATTQEATTAADTAKAAETSKVQEAATEKIVIGVAMDNIDEPFWQTALNGVKDKAKELGADVDVQVAQKDANLQNKQIEDMIAKGVKAVICAPHDNKTILQAVKKCNGANIPFIYLDRQVNNEDGAKVAWGAGTDNLALAQAGMQWAADMAKKNRQKLKLLELVGYLGDQNSMARSKGVAEAVKANSDVLELVKQVPTEGDIEKTLNGTVNALQANPDINCIFMLSDYFLDATLSALKQADRLKKVGEPGHVMIITFGGSKVSLDNIKDGNVDGCCIMDIYANGQQCADAAVKLANGQDAGAPMAYAGFVLSKENFEEKWKFAFGANE